MLDDILAKRKGRRFVHLSRLQLSRFYLKIYKDPVVFSFLSQSNEKLFCFSSFESISRKRKAGVDHRKTRSNIFKNSFEFLPRCLDRLQVQTEKGFVPSLTHRQTSLRRTTEYFLFYFILLLLFLHFFTYRNSSPVL